MSSFPHNKKEDEIIVFRPFPLPLHLSRATEELSSAARVLEEVAEDLEDNVKESVSTDFLIQADEALEEVISTIGEAVPAVPVADEVEEEEEQQEVAQIELVTGDDPEVVRDLDEDDEDSDSLVILGSVDNVASQSDAAEDDDDEEEGDVFLSPVIRIFRS